ncbi:PHD finger and BAH domain protein (Snt2), putative [Talaromyces stipitatus ATCC 10500]|uniref:PHD finger and BAH domain protein (Snt2), putative n=1 Tax=Talaromyces stipitatus (strain ATCC 10500 / CBS 375.48 / QM 6759 / NRRL 1006) TaxID=441959 RepID=B8MH56_TALSN|nr:PHD finger and BAH domain protein (Snt2), putative [Talaromyces stipitatus ATCC 10500]EED16870.1 PHD finger and BAH domain protein (Snt2), putative [Talaromyces stipitatus ATCC 10500]
MSEDSQSTESMPPSAEQSDSAGPGPANAHNTNNTDSPSSPARSKSRHAAPATKIATTTERPAEAKTANSNVAVAQSQPMTVSNSTSSEMTSITDAASNAAAPYSTRSRGRTNAARPNYAEDVEMDFELTSPASNAKSAVHSAKRNGISSVNGSPSAATDSEKGPAASTRKGHTATNGSQANGVAKDSIPGTSSFSTNGTSNNNASSAARKRKQPPSGATGANPNGSAKRVHTTSGYKHDIRLSNMMTFENSGARLRNGKLKADDGSFLEVNDHVYLICEPPGEPYYLGRIMEFLPGKGNPTGPVEMIRVNWYYRPKDIQRRVPDPRLVFASMHSDPCPLSSLRGKCTIKHVSEIENLEEYRKQRDCFWYEKMFDRYMLRYYEVVPTKEVINVPSHVKKVLDERWKFVLCETNRKKELTGAVKACTKCGLYAASVDSVDCAVCHSTYHMNCVRPKLVKKPARGFAWACALCSRAQERKLEARNTPLVGETLPDIEEDLPEEEEEEQVNNNAAVGTERSSPAADEDKKPAPATAAQISQAKMWPYRYYGVHCQLEDALDYDDRIYPRASSRLGTRHQAVVSPWYGRPVEYVKCADNKKKNKSSKSGSSKQSKAVQAAIEAERQERLKRPWVMDEPPGYIPRGEDEPIVINDKEVRTAQLLFKMPEPGEIPSTRGEDDGPAPEMSQEEREKFIDEYMNRARDLAAERGLPRYHTNFLDKALEYLYSEKFNVESALKRLKKADLYKDLKEPKLTKDQKALFVEGVSKYGSEWLNIRRHIGNIEPRHVVRYYYMWKKTPEGRRVWGSYEGRHGKKEAKRADSTSKLLDDIADEADDSAFDNEKASEKKRGFQCKFCLTRSSPQWRRAPLTLPGATVPAEPSSKKADKGPQLAVALCHRCAILWRKYAIEYKDADELAKKLQASGNKAWRRKLDDELCAQALVQQETPQIIATPPTGTGANTPSATEAAVEPPKKKARTAAEKDSASASARNSAEPPPKKKAVEKPVEPPPIIPDPPRAKILPCAICRKPDPTGEYSVTCRDCRLTVHRSCYGVEQDSSHPKWLCDMCSNDRNPIVSTRYECVLCPVTLTEQELMEAPKSSSHKKKTERDREKERMEKEMVVEAIKLYQQRQEAVGKPIHPREPLKRTVGNNWVHVNCAVWNPEIKFGKAEEMEPAEGFGLIPRERYREVCKICKTSIGACVSCHFPGCNAKFHVGCAHQAGYTFGFDVTPVKGSRRDSTITMKMGGESGSVSPCIWCPNHAVQSVVHDMSEPTEQNNLTALELYVRTYKQADLTMTGTVRKAAHVQQQHAQSMLQSNGSGHANRRASLINNAGSTSASERRNSTSTIQDPAEVIQPSTHAEPPRPQVEYKTCIYCRSTCSPRWWPVQQYPLMSNMMSNGMNHLMNGAPPMHSRTLSQTSNSYVNGDGIRQSEQAYECHKCHIKKPAAALQPPETLPAGAFTAQTPRGTLLPAPRQPEYPTYAPHGNPGPLPNVLATRPGPPPPPGPAPSGPEWYSSYDKRLGSHGGPQTNGYGHGQPAPYAGGPLPQLNGYASGPPPTATTLPSLPPASAPSHAHPSPGPGPGPSPLLPPTPHHHPPPGHYGPMPSNLPPPPPQPTHSYVGSAMGVPSMLSPRAPPARPFGTSMSPPDLNATLHRSSPSHGLNTGPPRSMMYPVDRYASAPSLGNPHTDTQPGTTDEHASQPSGRYTGPGPSGQAGPSTNGGSGASASPSLKNLLS